MGPPNVCLQQLAKFPSPSLVTNEDILCFHMGEVYRGVGCDERPILCEVR